MSSLSVSSLRQLPLHWQIIIALILAAIVGGTTTPSTQLLGISLLSVFDFVGTLFINALKMIVVPLVMASIIVGIAGIANDRAFGRLGLKTLVYYLSTSTFAILVGLALVNLIEPGASSSERLLLSLPDSSDFMHQVEGKSISDVAEVFLRMVPPNIFYAASHGQLLGLIFFSMVFGFFMAKLSSQASTQASSQASTQASSQASTQAGGFLLSLWQEIQEVMIKITLWIMKFAPYGVFALVGKTVMVSGMDAVLPVLKFFVTVLLALGVHFAIVLPLLLRFVAGMSPLYYIGRVIPALLTAFSTASSSATLPISLNVAQARAGISKRISSFTLPLGATVNMDGTALYECVVVLFIAQLYGVDMSLGTQLVVVILALMTSIGVAGIPAASLVAITLILTAVGLPVEAIGLILAVDRILDMSRTSVNVFSDLTAACVIARSEKEQFATSKADT